MTEQIELQRAESILITRFCQEAPQSAASRLETLSVEDAIGSYFVARALGARVLVIGDRMESLVKAIEDAIYSGRLYITGELPRVGEDDVPWSVSEINHEQEGDLQQW